MGKGLTSLAVCLMGIVWLSLPCDARVGDLDKATKKECRKTAARLTKDGWSVFGGQYTVEEALESHYQALAQGGNGVMWVEGSGTDRDVNRAVRKSHQQAATMYASMKKSRVKGETVAEMAEAASDGEADKLSSSYQTSTDYVVRSMKPSVVLCRTLADGTVEIRSLYVVKL